MDNVTKYQNAFCETFQIESDRLIGLSYQSIPLCDSVGHMALFAALDIMLDTYDIINLSSFEKGKEILSLNYDIVF
jgi:hypothetical protein